MARAKANPDPHDQIKALEAERSRIAIEKDASSRAVAAARETLGANEDAIRQRVLEATQAEARGREHESMEAIAQDAAAARSEIATHEARIAGLDRAIKEIAEEIEDVRAANVEHFRQAALARCEAFVQTLAADLKAMQERSAEYGEMAGDLSRVWRDEKLAKEKGLRGDVLLSEVPAGDLGAAENDIRKTRERLELLLRFQADKTTPSPRVIRSAANPPTDDPIVEMIG
jgi:chromosome segregation ATPase